MRVLIAFDKFKDSMSALTACDVASGALASLASKPEVDVCPLSDGGEGFAGILTRAAVGREDSAQVVGPRGTPLAATYGVVDLARIPAGARRLLGAEAVGSGSIGIIEMAAASGLALLAAGERDPMRTSSVGTGQLLRAAAAEDVRAIVLGVGGSATHDLGLGALEALGLGYVDAEGGMLAPLVPADWPRLAGILGKVVQGLPPILIACDVDNPLLGPRGALATYGPQKGLRPQDAAMLEEEGARIAALMCSTFGRDAGLVSTPGAGAAGGIAFGLMAAAGARLLPGFELVSSWLDLEGRLASADIVLTGEGRFDDSSLQGKGPGALARRALELGKRVHVFAGQVRLSHPVPGLLTHSVTPAGMPLSDALANAPGFLFSAVKRALFSL
jgi:glycerate kinase